MVEIHDSVFNTGNGDSEMSPDMRLKALQFRYVCICLECFT